MARVRAGWIRRCRTAGRASAAIAGFACVLAGALSAGSARAALLVYEPFDYAAGTVLDGVPATGTNLAGTWTPLGAIEAQKLVVSSPGLDYGNLAGAPPALGNRANDVNGVTAAGGTVSLASPLLVPPDSAIYWSVLLLLDDSLNGNRLANVTLADADTGDAIGFGEAGVGVRAIRITADTAATGGLVAEGADGSFSDGQVLLLIGRYVNAAAPGGDRLDLIGYDVADPDVLPPVFDPTDSQAEFAFSLTGLDVDLARISAITFTIRGDSNNAIDELRIGDAYASVVVPEPGASGLLGLGLAALACRSRRRRIASR